MSFFLPNRLDCFICGSTIGQRVDAARLFYAHPDDLGRSRDMAEPGYIEGAGTTGHYEEHGRGRPQAY